ncbi:substrate-binding domain-containing protein [Ramlibacter sp. WS9]|uniref:ABC transporter substrate-binding protein n=1 Tax=Ramlibacter sp. WS9 TaxID=1882741 RepID=UPI001141BFA4|nr:substrate-binding domain-containing protein [Ramlibacter sp. WS9]ROZ69606.1 sugar ABC transporter substrate-binding protein [Ramlibacter sp. WS9]
MHSLFSRLTLAGGLLAGLLLSLPAAAQQQPAAASQKKDKATVTAPADGTPLRDSSARDTERKVLAALARKKVWDGPTTGPKAQPGKTVIFIAADMKNGGIVGVSKGVEEATKAIGWQLRILDGQGSVQGRTAAMNQALTVKPDGIVLGGFDAEEQATALREAARNKVPVVGWHAGREATGNNGLFYNVTTKAQDVADIAALYAVMESKGKAGVVIFTDSAYSVAIAKSDAMAEVIRNCKGCTLLGIEDTPLADTSKRMPGLTAALLQKYGDKWTHSLGINDLYFDFMGPTLAAAGTAGKRLVNLSGGDGSESAYARIRKSQFQAGTVPEPLNLHGWQAVDELNRAIAGQPPSGYMTPVHLVTPQTIVFDGGPKNSFDPDNGYREAYKKIWKK